MDSFAAARNESLRRATGEWAFWMDADDRLDETNRSRLRALLADLPTGEAAFVMKCLCLGDPAQQSATMVDHIRLFRNHPEVRWQYRVHEQILPGLRRRNVPVRWSDVVVCHVGYQDPALRGRKLERDLRLLQQEDGENPDDPFTLFNLGQVYLDRDEPDLALPRLRRSLERSHPADSIVRKLFGLLVSCHRRLHQPALALTACREGRKYYPDDAELLFDEAVMLREQGDNAGAETNLLRLLGGQEPAHFASVDTGLRGYKARHNLAVLYREKGREAEAEAQWQEAVRAQPDFRPGWLGLAELYGVQGRWEKVDEVVDRLGGNPVDRAVLRARGHLARKEFAPARQLLEETVARAPEAPWPRRVLSHVLLQEGKDWQAAAAHRQAIAIRPDYVDAYNNLGLALAEGRRAADAVPILEQALRLRPQFAEADNNLGLALADLGRFAEAEAAHREALRIKPRYVEAHNNFASLLKAQGRIREALAAYQVGLWLDPQSVSCRWNRALALLQAGELAQGWVEYEWRWRRPKMAPRSLPGPAWDGGPLEGRTILVYMEQGLGDMIQFVRYATLLKRRGATVVVECPRSLSRLFTTCPGIDRLLREGEPPPAYDLHVALMSLPRCCGTTAENIPAEVPYLSALPERVEKWARELGERNKFRIGIAWQGNRFNLWDHHRSVPLACFAPIAAVPGVKLISLQKGPATEQIAPLNGRFRVQELASELNPAEESFVDSAAIIENLDLVITVDTAIAHLAGALGKEVWLALSTLVDWRWLLDRDDSPWYPSMRLFRQPRQDDWEPVFTSMAEGLSRRLAGPRLGAAVPFRSTAAKVVDWPTVAALRQQARAEGRTVVWTNGCFDLLHPGHVQSLEAARRLGDLLVVGINDDESVRRLKGQGRPVLPADQRAALLAALACVDYVTIFREDTPERALASLQPEVHCKGADYTPPGGRPIPEAAVVAAYGGRVEFLPLLPDHSTSEILSRIRGKPSRNGS